MPIDMRSREVSDDDDDDHGDGDGVVDRPTQLICISDIFCRQTNTKDIAGQSARSGWPTC